MELPEDDIDVDVGGIVVIPESTKAVGPIPHGIIFEVCVLH